MGHLNHLRQLRHLPQIFSDRPGLLAAGKKGIPDTVKPTLVSCVIDSAGTTATITHSEAVFNTVVTDYAISGFTLSNMAGSWDVRTVTISPPIPAGYVALLAYTKGTTSDIAGNLMDTTLGVFITNNSTYLGATVAVSTPIATLANGDPVSTWPDASGNGLDFTNTLTSRPSYVSADPSVLFADGKFLKHADDTLLRLGANFTLLAEVSWDGTADGSGYSSIVAKAVDGTHLSWWWILTPGTGKPTLTISADGSAQSADDPADTALTANVMTKIAVSWDGTTASYYKGGLPDGMATLSVGGTPNANTSQVEIGGFFNGSIAAWHGKIKRVAIVRRTMTDGEVAAW